MTKTTPGKLNPKELGFDPKAIEEKYRQERDKRLRSDGGTQYQDLEGDLKHLGLDAFADHGFERDPIDTHVGTLIVGGGYGGVLVAVRLTERGFRDFVIVEKGSSYGGTWYWNQYPGARCDVESYIYMPLLEEIGFIPSEKYATGNEIRKHFDEIRKRWNLESKTQFQTEVKDMTWDDHECHWVVRTSRGDVFRARHVVTATGILHKPKLLRVPGITSFKGRSFHTSRWDYDYTGGRDNGILSGLTDKRVAIIGTGATSIQVVPEVAKYAKQLYVFQRTPASVNVRNNHRTKSTFVSSLKPGWQRARMENFNAILAGAPVEEDLVNDGWTDVRQTLAILGSESSDDADITETIQLADYQKMERIRARVDEIVKDKKTAEELKPWYASVCKRLCFHDEYLQAFNKPNCTLVDTDGKGIERITERGVVANGREYEVDLIVYSTGFTSPAKAWQQSDIKIKGRGSLSLREKWDEEIATLFGIQTCGFPNYFIISVMQAGVSPNYTYTLDSASKHIAYIISECEKAGVKYVEPTGEAEKKWVEIIVNGNQSMGDYFRNCTPSYFNNEGQLEGISKNGGTYSGGASAWGRVLEEWREKGGMEGLQVLKAYTYAKL